MIRVQPDHQIPKSLRRISKAYEGTPRTNIAKKHYRFSFQRFWVKEPTHCGQKYFGIRKSATLSIGPRFRPTPRRRRRRRLTRSFSVLVECSVCCSASLSSSASFSHSVRSWRRFLFTALSRVRLVCTAHTNTEGGSNPP